MRMSHHHRHHHHHHQYNSLSISVIYILKCHQSKAHLMRMSLPSRLFPWINEIKSSLMNSLEPLGSWSNVRFDSNHSWCHHHQHRHLIIIIIYDHICIVNNHIYVIIISTSKDLITSSPPCSNNSLYSSSCIERSLSVYQKQSWKLSIDYTAMLKKNSKRSFYPNICWL